MTTKTPPQKIQYKAFIDDLLRYKKGGSELRIEDGIDLVFTCVDALLRSGRFTECDKLLRMLNFHIKTLDSNILLSFLTITLTASSKLRHRVRYFKTVKNEFIRRDIKQLESVLRGLETYESGPFAGALESLMSNRT